MGSRNVLWTDSSSLRRRRRLGPLCIDHQDGNLSVLHGMRMIPLLGGLFQHTLCIYVQILDIPEAYLR